MTDLVPRTALNMKVNDPIICDLQKMADLV